ncbi:MAG: hypothetical protein AB1664_05035 [Thermodesulfobacteriota bacterium]
MSERYVRLSREFPRSGPTQPRTTRTARDLVMIGLGVFLIVLFVVAGYISLRGDRKALTPKNRGPVRDPKQHGFYDSGQVLPAAKKTTAYGSPTG